MPTLALRSHARTLSNSPFLAADATNGYEQDCADGISDKDKT